MARIPYDFTPFPRKLHPGWAGRSHASWGLCVRLWLLADGQPIQVHGADWRASLCQQMGLSGRDRPTTRALMADLQSDGLMTPRDGFVHVKFHPDQEGRTTTELRTELVAEESARGSTGVQPGVVQESYPLDLSDRNHSDRFLQTDRQTDKTDSSARARETTTTSESFDFRKPLPEPPPNLPPREQPLGEWIAAEHAKRHVARTGTTPGGSNRYDLARQVAKWVEGNSEAYKVSNRALATSLLDGLFASTVAGAKGWGLGWLVNKPQEFCGLPPGVKPVEAPKPDAPKSNNPTHAEWKAPDYKREMLESYDPERIAREREEWFKQCPPAREAWERDQSEAELAPAPRVVVSIAEAKQPEKSYRPKSPEEIAARRALLEEQARALKAAASAAE